MKEFLAKFKPIRRHLPWLAVAAFMLILPGSAHAGIDTVDYIGEAIAAIFQFFTSALGYLLLTFVGLLIEVAQYNNFVGADAPAAVAQGWLVARDLANMFFIVILIIIAFGTILSLDQYHYSKHLSKLLITAVAINFSKTICGIFIDMGQVIMLTFVNGFASAAGGNFLRAFQIEKLLQLRDVGATSGFQLALGMFLAFVLVAISLGVVIAITLMLVTRVITLWILIIVSPLTWMTRAMPFGGAESYYKDWWSKFRTNIVAGPVLAFFLWLTLFTVQASNGNIAAQSGMVTRSGPANTAEVAAFQSQAGIPTEAAQWDAILSLIIACAMLLAGLDMASKSGAIGAGVAGSVKDRLRKYGAAAGGFAWRNTGGAAIRGTKAAGAAAGRTAVAATLVGGGVALSKISRGKYGGTAIARGQARFDQQAEARKKLKEAFIAPTNDQAIAAAKASPASLERMIGKLEDKDKVKAINAVSGDEKAMKALEKEPATIQRLADMAKQAKENGATFSGAYKEFTKKNFKHLNDGQKIEAAGFIGTAEAETLKPELLENREFMAEMDGKNIQHLLREGTDVQRNAITSHMKRIGTADQGEAQVDADKRVRSFLAQKGISAKDVDASMMKSIPGAVEHVLEMTKKNQAILDEIMSDSDKAAAITAHVESQFNTMASMPPGTAPPAAASKAVLNAIKIGTIDAEKIKTDAKTRAFVGSNLNTTELAKIISSLDSGGSETSKAALGAYIANKPDAFEKLGKHHALAEYIDDSMKPPEPDKAGKSPAQSTPAPAAAPTQQPSAPVAQPAQRQPPPTPPLRNPMAVAPQRATVTAALNNVSQEIGRLETLIRSQPGATSTPRNQGELSKLREALNDLSKTIQSRNVKQNQWNAAKQQNKPQTEIDQLGKELADLNRNLARKATDLGPKS